MIDLHTHSRFSDGSDTPNQLADKAREMGISAISLTDHDTTDGHDEMAAACARCGIELVSGVEVSVRDHAFPEFRGHARNVHVLAYFLPFDPAHPFQLKLRELRDDRHVRNVALVERLNDLGFADLTMEYLSSLARDTDSIARPHFAQAMFNLRPDLVGERTTENWNRLFVEWLGKDGRAYVPKDSMPIEDFVDSGRGAGTVFSVAHPLLNYLDDSTSIEATMPRVMASLRERGVQGVEAYYGSNDAATRDLMVKFTRDAGMIPTGGSDYHGDYKRDVKLGVGRSGDLIVPDEVLDQLKAVRQLT